MTENPYIVYCANCREVFISRGKKCAHILDIAMNLPVDSSLPKIHEKRKNAIDVKKRLLRELSGVDFDCVQNSWDSLELIIPPELAVSIEKKMISQSDIKEAIWSAESSGNVFIDSSGVTRCSNEKQVLTYWVAYRKKESGVYEILEAYSHRMKFSKAEA